jgi:hypothetical protein
MIVMHCAGHAGALIAEEAAEIPFLVFMCEGVQNIYNSGTHSYKQRGARNEMARALGENAVQNQKIHLIRWLSREGAFCSCLRTIFSRMVCLAANSNQEGTTAAGKDNSATSVLDGPAGSVEFLLGLGPTQYLLKQVAVFNKTHQEQALDVGAMVTSKRTLVQVLQAVADIPQMPAGACPDHLELHGALRLPVIVTDVGHLKDPRSLFTALTWSQRHASLAVPNIVEGNDMKIVLAHAHKSTISKSKKAALDSVHSGVVDFATKLIGLLNAKWPEWAISFWSAFGKLLNVHEYKDDSEFGDREIAFLACHYGTSHTVTKDPLFDGWSPNDEVEVAYNATVEDNGKLKWNAGEEKEKYRARVLLAEVPCDHLLVTRAHLTDLLATSPAVCQWHRMDTQERPHLALACVASCGTCCCPARGRIATRSFAHLLTATGTGSFRPAYCASCNRHTVQRG